MSETPCTVAPSSEPRCAVVPQEMQVRRFVPFLVSSLSLAVGVGATLGTLSLMRLTGTWGPLSRSWVWAHGYVQVFGFLGLFVMGFAYHGVPRFVGAALRPLPLVTASLWCQVGGVLAVAGGFLAPLPAVVGRALWILGACALLAGASLFGVVLASTIRARSAPPQSFERWMVAGAVWLAVASLTALIAAVLDDIAWHQLLWPASLYGFAGSWIFGAGRRLFGSSLGWKGRWPALERPVFFLYQAGAIAWCAGAWPGDGAFRTLRGLGALALLLAVSGYAVLIGWLRPGSTLGSDPEFRLYERWVHAGWGWLLVGLLTGPGWTLSRVLVGERDSITMLDFSRHALGLGFATHMVMGMGNRFVPVFCGTRLWSPRAHALAFWLLSLSLAIRLLEVPLAAGYWPAVWPLLAFSGPPAALAFALFAGNVFAAILGWGRPIFVRSGRTGKPPAAAAVRVLMP